MGVEMGVTEVWNLVADLCVCVYIYIYIYIFFFLIEYRIRKTVSLVKDVFKKYS